MKDMANSKDKREDKEICFVYIMKDREGVSVEENLLREFSIETFSNNLSSKSILSENALNTTITEILKVSESPFIAVSTDDTMYFSKEWPVPLIMALDTGFDLAAPVSNDFFEIDMPYFSPSTFNDASEHMRKKYHGQYIASTLTTSTAFIVKRKSLSPLPPDTLISELPCLLKSAIVPSSIVHRFGDYYSSQRNDILPYLPDKIKKVLDVGCAKGILGETIKKKYGCEVYGVELNEAIAAEAMTKLNTVFCVDIEKADLPFHNDLDVIIFADILEHLIDPWTALKNTLKWLKPDGIIVASIPNTAHYSIVSDLLRGQWDYIPFGLLCITHLRFFTKRTIVEMFEKNGFSVLTIQPQEYSVALKEQVMERLSALIKIEHINEEIFHPGYYIVAQPKHF